MKDDSLYEPIAQLYQWKYQYDPSNFVCQLYDLFKKADRQNFARLANGFPLHARALQLWEQAGNFGNDLFELYEIYDYKRRRP